MALNRVDIVKTNAEGRKYVEDLNTGIKVTSLNSESDNSIVHYKSARGVEKDKFYLFCKNQSHKFKVENTDKSKFKEKSFGLIFKTTKLFDKEDNNTKITVRFGSEEVSLIFAPRNRKITSNFDEVRYNEEDETNIFCLFVDIEKSTINFIKRFHFKRHTTLTIKDFNGDIQLEYFTKSSSGMVIDDILLINEPDFQSLSGNLQGLTLKEAELLIAPKKLDPRCRVKYERNAEYMMPYLRQYYPTTFLSMVDFMKALGYIPKHSMSLYGLSNKLLELDLITSTGIAKLNIKNKIITDRLKIARAVQRIVSMGQTIGDGRDFLGKKYGTMLGINEAVRIVDSGYYSAAQLARSSVDELRQIVFLDQTVSTDSASISEKDIRERIRHNNRAKFLLTAARQRAHLVALAYINTKNLSNPALIAAQRSKDDPELTFENLYASGEYFDVPPNRSVYSLSAYTVALKELITTHVDIDASVAKKGETRLDQRRPDIDHILVSAENSNKLQPKLIIINKLLRYHASTDKSQQITDEAMDHVVYPFNFPFNVHYNNIDTNLANMKLSWSQIRQAFGTNPFNEYTLGISPSIIEEIARDNPFSQKDVTSPINLSDLKKRWGGDDTQYQTLANVKDFTYVSGIDESTLPQLLFADLSTDEIAGGEMRQLYLNTPTTRGGDPLPSLVFSADATQIENLSDTHKDRSRRLLMLSKSQNISIVNLYRLLRATGNRINREFLQCVAAYRHLQREYKLTLDEFISLIANMRSVGKGSGPLPNPTFVQTIFHREGQPLSLFDDKGNINNLTLDPSATTNEQGLLCSTLAKLLNISDTEVKIAARMINDTGTVPLNLETLSALYRITLLCRMFGMSVADMDALRYVNSNRKKLLSPATPLSDKLAVLEELIQLHSTFTQLRKGKTLPLSPAELYRHTNNDSNLTLTDEDAKKAVILLKEALQRSDKVEIETFNEQLSAIGCDPITADTLATFVKDGLIHTVKPLFIASLSDDKKAKVQTLIDTLFAAQQNEFETALAEVVKLKPEKRSIFSSWLSSITLVDDNASNMTDRLDKLYNLPLRKTLTGDAPLTDKRLILQRAQQLAAIIRLFSLTPANWQTLLKQPTLLSGFALGKLPTFNAVLGLATYEQATKAINNQETPIFTLAQQQSDNTTAVAQTMASWFKNSETVDFISLMTIFATKGTPHKSLDGLGRLVLAFQHSRKIRLKPAVIQQLLAVGESGSRTYKELADLQQRIKGELQSDQNIAKQAQALELESLRDRLLSLALHRMRKQGLPVHNEQALQRYLLTDVLVGGETLSTPVKEASLSLQDFAKQVLNNQVPGHKPNETFKEYWEWMSSYTKWEANRRNFLENENYLSPELRRNRSEPFVRLQSRLSAINEETKLAEKEFRLYAQDLLGLINLQTVAIADGAPAKDSILIVAKKSVGTVNAIYFREMSKRTLIRGSNDGIWRKINGINLTDNESRSMSACYAFGKWHLFWLTYRNESSFEQKASPFSAITLHQSTLDENDNWSAPKELRKAFVPSNIRYEHKANFQFVRAYNNNSMELSGSISSNRRIWSRFDNIQTALKTKGSGKELTEVLYNEIKPDAYANNIRNRDELDLSIISQAHWIDNDKKRIYNFFTPNPLKSHVKSELKNEQDYVRNSKFYTKADGIILVLPPVFGIYQGEMIDIYGLKNTAKMTIRNPSKVQLTNNGINWGKENPDYESDYSSNKSVSKIMLNSEGDLNIITHNKLRLINDSSITNQAELHGLEYGKTPLQNKNVEYLTSSGTVGQIGLAKLKQVLDNGDKTHHEYLFNRQYNQVSRVRSHAARKLLRYLGQVELDDFMSPNLQSVSENSFSALKPQSNLIPVYPPDYLSFDDFNGASYWELFFHAPMAIAQSLKEDGKYHEAERWYHFVINPQSGDGGIAAEETFKQVQWRPRIENNSVWRSLALRKNEPIELKGEVYYGFSEGSFDSSSFIKNFVHLSRKPVDLQFKMKAIDFGTRKGPGYDDFKKPRQLPRNALTKDVFGEENIIYERDGVDYRNKELLGSVTRIRGTLYLDAGHYYIQSSACHALTIFMDGETLVQEGLKYSSSGKEYVYNNYTPLVINKSGLHCLDVFYVFTEKTDTIPRLKINIVSARPGIPVRDNTYFNIKYDRGGSYAMAIDKLLHKVLIDKNYDFKPITTQKVHEQRLLNEINSIDNDLALTTYVNDPYNPHALAAVNTNAYRIWTFYEYIDNLIKQGDVEFRRFTRESLPRATLLYNQAEQLLGDPPVNRGILKNIPRDSTLKDIVSGSLLDFDGDGDVDIDDANIQGQRLIDANNGSLQQAMELLLENRLSRVSKVHYLPASGSKPRLPYTLPGAEFYADENTELKLAPPGRFRIKENTDSFGDWNEWIKVGTKKVAVGEAAKRTRNFAIFESSSKRCIPQTFLDNSYFAIPQNQRTLGLWKKIGNRLSNIRNGRNINGERVILPITQPPVSPDQFARRAADGKLDVKKFFTSADAPIPHYRFSYAIDRAEAFTELLMSYGSKLLSLYQSKDTAQLEELRAGYEQSILEAGKLVLQEQLKAAEAFIGVLLKSYGNARFREYTYTRVQNIKDGQYLNGNTISKENYQVIDLAGTNKAGQQDQYAKIGVDFATQRKKNIESFRNAKGERMARNKQETNASNVRHAAFAGNSALAAVEAVGKFLDVAPNIFGFSVGGSKWSATVDGGVAIGRLAMDIMNYVADTEASKSELIRRAGGWELTRQLAILDQNEFEERLVQANHDRLAIKQQITNMEAQIKQNKTLTDLVKTGRIGTSELFGVLLKGMVALYKELYKIAMAAAREAERAWIFEKARAQNFDIKDVWEEGRKGLLAAESLMLTLQQMRKTYMQENKRRFEIVKAISLKNNPDIQVEGSSKNVITTLQSKSDRSRSVTFTLPSRIFDRDYPGHILRQIKSVRITIPAVIGPYENVGATLKQLDNNVLLYSDVTAALEMNKGNARGFSSNAIRKDFRNNEAIAVSTGVDDAGMFQLNFDDPRFLPFEGTGVDSKWCLEFSEFMPEHLFKSINDIIMEIRYTAEQGEGALKNAVIEAIRASAA